MATAEFLKECMADALLNLMLKKDFSKIKVDEIAAMAGVHRSTWFRNFSSKSDALTYKIVQLWARWAEDQGLASMYTVENALDFFRFCHENRRLLLIICRAGLQPVLYDAFYQVILPQERTDAADGYRGRFYAYGLFGFLNEWIKRGFRETPEELNEMFQEIL